MDKEDNDRIPTPICALMVIMIAATYLLLLKHIQDEPENVIAWLVIGIIISVLEIPVLCGAITQIVRNAKQDRKDNTPCGK